MPGLGIPGFATHARAIAKAGVYDLTIHHDQILVPMLLRQWQIDRIEGLDAEAEQARERVLGYLAKSRRVARRLAERRESASLASV
jgi:acyl-[acyl-carrier-protein] desaturase